MQSYKLSVFTVLMAGVLPGAAGASRSAVESEAIVMKPKG